MSQYKQCARLPPPACAPCRGEDMVPVAHALHGRAVGFDAPFILCDRRRRNVAASLRSPANHASTVAAYGRIRVALRARLATPADLASLFRLFHEPDSRALLIICTDSQTRGRVLNGPLPIEVPSLAIREAELPRIIDEFADDAVAALHAPPRCFQDRDRDRVIENSARSLSEIEKGTRRIVAIRVAANLNQTAAIGAAGGERAMTGWETEDRSLFLNRRNRILNRGIRIPARPNVGNGKRRVSFPKGQEGFSRGRLVEVTDEDCSCERRDSNPHTVKYRNLNPACLPVPPRSRGATYSTRVRAASVVGRRVSSGRPTERSGNWEG